MKKNFGGFQNLATKYALDASNGHALRLRGLNIDEQLAGDHLSKSVSVQ